MGPSTAASAAPAAAMGSANAQYAQPDPRSQAVGVSGLPRKPAVSSEPAAVPRQEQGVLLDSSHACAPTRQTADTATNGTKKPERTAEWRSTFSAKPLRSLARTMLNAHSATKQLMPCSQPRPASCSNVNVVEACPWALLQPQPQRNVGSRRPMLQSPPANMKANDIETMSTIITHTQCFAATSNLSTAGPRKLSHGTGGGAGLTTKGVTVVVAVCAFLTKTALAASIAPAFALAAA
mmetsp:Transcript_90621/g.261166  ORF Transcript_90621/g.261166 Transcript_90621/m.261166 type:complete len:237 (+) Transcript_90621:536-1246(+)